MNFGQNLYNWFLSNAQSLVLLAIVVIGLYLGFRRGLRAAGIKDILLELFNRIIGA